MDRLFGLHDMANLAGRTVIAIRIKWTYSAAPKTTSIRISQSQTAAHSYIPAKLVPLAEKIVSAEWG